MAKLGAKMWKKHGALDYQECKGDDLHIKGLLSPLKLVKAKANETVWFSFIVYKSKAHRNEVNKKVMKDPKMDEMPKEMPFDIKKMACGGFKTIVRG